MSITYILGIGSRGWKDGTIVQSMIGKVVVASFGHEVRVVSGGARGADSLVRLAAGVGGLRYREFAADWDQFGKSAGFRRNQEMCDFLVSKREEGHTVVCLAFDLGTPGTAQMMRLCKRAGVPVMRVAPASAPVHTTKGAAAKKVAARAAKAASRKVQAVAVSQQLVLL